MRVWIYIWFLAQKEHLEASKGPWAAQEHSSGPSTNSHKSGGKAVTDRDASPQQYHCKLLLLGSYFSFTDMKHNCLGSFQLLVKQICTVDFSRVNVFLVFQSTFKIQRGTFHVGLLQMQQQKSAAQDPSIDGFRIYHDEETKSFILSHHWTCHVWCDTQQVEVTVNLQREKISVIQM